MKVDRTKETAGISRRKFISLTGAALAASTAALAVGVLSGAGAAADAAPASGGQNSGIEPFFGPHQGGILTTPQKHTYFAAFDLTADKREDVVGLLREWTDAAARLTSGLPARPITEDPSQPAQDGGEALGLKPERLTITFGFGPGLFIRDGQDRYGLKARRPAALVDLPHFDGDQLQEARTGGDLSIQACSDDPQVAFHAIRELVRVAYGAVDMRWAQTGFIPNHAPGETPRNLMGFKDGTSNPSASNPHDMAHYVWSGTEGPDWMRGGSYVVVRRIRVALEHWDRMTLGFQEQTIGRHKYSGAAIGSDSEFEPVHLDKADKDGNPLIADNAHVRLAVAATNDGARIFRRPYSFNDGVSFTAERWPPWRQGMEYEAGLFFVAYQSDPRTGFIKIFENMSKFDQMNQFATHVGGGIFACPGGIGKGEFIGQRLFG